VKKIVWIVCFVVACCLFQAFGGVVSSQRARSAVEGWLNEDSSPLDASLGRSVRSVKAYSDTNSVPLFYVHSLDAGGFVISSADDMVSPIIAFSDSGSFDAATNSPLWVLLHKDMRGRNTRVRQYETRKVTPATMSASSDALEEKLLDSKSKWARFSSTTNTLIAKTASSSFISDVWVSPLMESTWDQDTVSGSACYNYYTPPYSDGNANNYPVGCVATAMAQVMRYHEYPTAGIGVHEDYIYVDGSIQYVDTRGGDGSGGAYNWDLMPLIPGSGITLAQRKMIGALCYDAGVSCSMSYASSGSGSNDGAAAWGLLNVFGFANAIYYMNYGYNMTTDFRNRVINCNLDAGCPVMVGITESSSGVGHEIVCDGYGYNSSTLYHHMNLGWSGSYNLWYTLPDIGAGYDFDIIDGFVYNIFPSGSGEILSGRVTDEDGNPLEGVAVSSGSYSDTTDENGIYALSRIASGTHTLTASKNGYESGSLTETVSASYDHYGDNDADYNSCGNVWGVDFALSVDSSSYDGWLSAGGVSSGALGYDDDPAGDGIANIWKYAAGIPARNVCTWQDIYTWTNDVQNSLFSLIYYQSIDASDSSLTPEWAGVLDGSWQASGVTTEMIDSNPTQEVWKASISANSNGFIRLTVELEE
jgi:hypothetical protein